MHSVFFVFARELPNQKAVHVALFLSSLPMAYIGGRLPISEKTFFILLGVSLFIAGTRLFLDDEKCKRDRVISKKEMWLLGLPLGTVLGFVSGITGIGGGIFLAPILYFLGWTHAKAVAACASLFILLNSLSGFLGQLMKNQFEINMNFALPLMIAVFCGGQVGSRFCVNRFSFQTLKKLTALLIIVVSLRILVNIVL